MPTYQPNEAPVWSGEASYDDKHSGTLYITNRRVLFEHTVGVIRKKNALAAEIPLKDVASTSIEKGPWNWTVLVIDASNRRHRFLFRLESPDELIKRISELLAGRKTQEKGEGAQPPTT